MTRVKSGRGTGVGGGGEGGRGEEPNVRRSKQNAYFILNGRHRPSNTETRIQLGSRKIFKCTHHARGKKRIPEEVGV